VKKAFSALWTVAVRYKLNNIQDFFGRATRSNSQPAETASADRISRQQAAGSRQQAAGDIDQRRTHPQAAALSGLPHLQVVFVGHLVSTLVSLLCVFILVGFVGKGSVTLGQDLALNSLAAAILGGVNFGSGPGGMLGPAVAAFILTFLFNFLASSGLGESGRLMLQGTIIAAAALAYSIVAVKLFRTHQ
jgi:ribose/xylose/arabinose/galactoside ABC-type transport system permease subunit